MYYYSILLLAVSFLINCNEVVGFMANSELNSSPLIRTSLTTTTTTTTKIPVNSKSTTHTSSSSTSLLMSSKFDSKYYIPAEQTARSGNSPSQSRITLSRFVSHKQFIIMKKFIILKPSQSYYLYHSI
jgi:hypothetical protein